MTLIINYSELITGHDEYGLGKFGLIILFIIGHIIIGFTKGICVYLRSRKINEI
jgi:hypothetical protein